MGLQSPKGRQMSELFSVRPYELGLFVTRLHDFSRLTTTGEEIRKK